jgi:hypothetical protein
LRPVAGVDIGTAEDQEKLEKKQLYFRCERHAVRAAEIAASLLARIAG